MNPKVKELTGIQARDLKKGISFSKAYQDLVAFCGNNFCFLTWGNDDIGILRENMEFHGIPTDGLPRSYNLQPMFNRQISKSSGQISLAKAVEMVGEEAYKAHDALNDALSTALVCKHLDIEQGIFEYGSNRKNKSTRIVLNTSSAKRISSASYRKIEKGIEDKRVTTFTCPSCKAKNESVEWTQKSKSKFITIVKCECGEEFFSCILFKKTQVRSLLAYRMVERIDDKNRDAYVRMLQYHKELNEAQEGYTEQKKAPITVKSSEQLEAITIKPLDKENIKDINLSNEPFEVIGSLKLMLYNGKWSAAEVLTGKTKMKQYPNYDGASIEDYLNSSGRAAFIAYHENKCVGQILLARSWNNYAHIEDISVATAYRRRGVGEGLVKEAEKWATENGLFALSVECQDNNILASRFLKKQGFEIGGVNTRLYSMLDEPYKNETAVFWYKRCK